MFIYLPVDVHDIAFIYSFTNYFTKVEKTADVQETADVQKTPEEDKTPELRYIIPKKKLPRKEPSKHAMLLRRHTMKLKDKIIHKLIIIQLII